MPLPGIVGSLGFPRSRPLIQGQASSSKAPQQFEPGKAMWRGMRVCCWVLLAMTCAHNGAYAMEAQPQEPPIPGHPTSDKDCDVWGQQLDEYWENKVLKSAREGDADCKSISKDPSKLIADQPCGNVVDAKVSYKFCDREDYFRQCFAKQKETGLRQCRERLPKSTNQPNQNRGRSTRK